MSECLKVIVVQPTVPSYRVGFFDRLADQLGSGFVVYASPGKLGVLTENPSSRDWERVLGPMHRLLPGVEWQAGALSVPIARGDVLVVTGAPRCLSNLALFVKARWIGAKTIWWGHYWSSTSRPWRAGLRMLLMKLADAILFYTDREVEEYLSTRTGVSRPIGALNNGIETSEIVRLRMPYDPVQRPRDLLFIGRLTEKSELGLLLEALASSVCAGIKLDVVGGGEGELELRRRAEELGIAARVSWHGGVTEERRIAEIANACKAFIYPGAVGLSLIHGFAYGLPAIVHEDRWRHMPEIAALRAGENGVTFRRGNAASLARTLRAMLADSKRLTEMSVAAIETTARTFNAHDMEVRFSEMVAKVSTGFRHRVDLAASSSEVR